MRLAAALLLLGLSVSAADATPANQVQPPESAAGGFVFVSAAVTPPVFGAPDPVVIDDQTQPSRDESPAEGRANAEGLGTASAGVAGNSGPQDIKPPDKSDAKKPPTPAHTGIHALFDGLKQDVRHLPSIENAYIALVGGAGAVVVHPFDQSFNAHLRSHYDLVNTIYTPAKWVGESPTQLAAALVVYSVGRLEDQPKTSHLGMDLLRAQIIDEVLTELLKVAVERERPNGADHMSFPSGHASMTFTTATVIERHLGWKYSVLGYAIAAYVSSSRLHDNVHWLSDVVFGAAVGTICGRTVTQHGRNVWTFAPVGVPGGVEVVAMRIR